MLKKVNNLMNTVISCTVGMFVGMSSFTVMHHKSKPELYAGDSAPWYTSILVYAAASFIIITAAVIAKAIIRKKLK